MKMDDRVAAIRSGEQPKTFEPVTVQSMFDAWMVEVETNCKPRTVRDYKSRWAVHLKSTFGNLFATQVTRDTVATYLNQRMKEGAGPITRNRENRVLQMIFNYNREKIPVNNFPTFPKFNSEKAHVHRGRLSPKDFQTVMTRLDNPKLFWFKALVTMTFKYGFRKSELLTAKVGYFDPKTSKFTLPAFTTKNKIKRAVTIQRDGEIYKMLAQLTANHAPNDAVFTRNSKPVQDYRGTWAKVTEGITHGQGGEVTIHDLRRSAITGMVNKGITADQAGTHLTGDVFRRYIVRSEDEEQATAAAIES